MFFGRKLSQFVVILQRIDDNGGGIVGKKYFFIVGTFLILGLYVGFLFKEEMDNGTMGNAPEIMLDSSELTISVNDDENVLMTGVSANDNEDGDITDNVLIENISPFDENGNRVVTYAVFDADSQISKATRTIDYIDYVAPRFTLSAPLILTLDITTEDQLYKNIGAVSSVDGNITSKISINQNLEDSGSKIALSVTDSTGTTSSLELNIEKSLNILTANLNIQLTDYLVYVNLGDQINPLDYVSDILLNNSSRRELIDEIDVDHNFQADVPGIYEFRYTINRSNGDFGMTKLVVIVEG